MLNVNMYKQHVAPLESEEPSYLNIIWLNRASLLSSLSNLIKWREAVNTVHAAGNHAFISYIFANKTSAPRVLK